MSRPDLIDTVQLQETDDAIVHLFDLKLPSGTEINLVDGMDGTANIYFSNKAGTAIKEYIAVPISIDGIEFNGEGASPRPTLSIANVVSLTRSISNDGDGTSDEETFKEMLEDEGIISNDDVLGSYITCRTTMLKHTQRAGDSPTVPVEFPSQSYILDRVSSENQIVVQFELASPIDVEGVTLPRRVVIGKYCPWEYQGAATKGVGGCTWPIDSRGRFFDIDDNVITKNISSISTWSSSTSSYAAGTRVKTTTGGHIKIWEAKLAVPQNKNPETASAFWKRVDVCGKLINSCKVRYQGNNSDDTLDIQRTLFFGGFPGSKKFR